MCNKMEVCIKYAIIVYPLCLSSSCKYLVTWVSTQLTRKIQRFHIESMVLNVSVIIKALTIT